MIGVLMSFMLTIPRAGRMRLTEFVVAPEGYVRERLPEDVPSSRVLIFGLEGEMFFGASSALEHHFEEIESRLAPETEVVVLRLKRVHNPDAVGMAELDLFLDRMETLGVRVLLCGVRKYMLPVLERVGVVDRLGDGQVFLEQPVRQTSTASAVAYAATLLQEGTGIGRQARTAHEQG